MAKRGLGRGLDALIPVSDQPAGEGGGTIDILVTRIMRNPRQPRTRMDSQDLADLAASIREHGVIQPLIVARGEGEQFTLIAGERRLEASKLAGLATVPAIVRGQTSDQALLELALIENIQRADLTPLESAQAYKHLADDFNLSHDEIAKRVGKQRTTVSNTLRLLKLPPKIQGALAQGLINEGHARALLALPNAQAQLAALSTVIGKGLNVRQTEELVRQLGGQKKPKPVKSSKPADVRSLENKLRDSLGTRVSLNRGRKGGTIVIHFYSDDDLNALTDRLLDE